MKTTTAGQRRQLQRQKRDRDLQEIATLEKLLSSQAPPSGTNPLAEDLNKSGEKNVENYWPMAKEFVHLPISERTKRGLHNGGFKDMTEVQRATLPHALVGRDVLGSAKTGSGKTLAFLIPVLEKLYRMKWTKMDGLGALIISPTRELALQTFSVLRAIGAPHTFSAGLLIGGTNWKAEQHRIGNINILVATPGRLLQHMDESPTFRTENLQILVLDEADRILSNGFQREVNAIIANLPTERQTLLFSATQTSSVSDLARLSLNKPEFLSIHAEATIATPDQLVQNYIILEEGEKLNVLWSFIKAHLRKKILVFFHTLYEVKFVHEAFRHMRPGMPVWHLHGKMGQTKRKEIYDQFDKAKFAVMLATDVAARGLDFEGVNWVIQVDCPENVATYIHRVGRTARFMATGRSTLFLLPSESSFRDKLIDAKIPISRTNINKAKALEIDVALQALMVQKPELKVLAQKALKAYLKSIYLMSDKAVFDITKMDMEALANSWGLLQIPNIKFANVKKIDKYSEIMKAKVQQIESKIKQLDESGAQGDDDLLKVFQKKKKEQGKTKLEKLLEKKNADVLSPTAAQFRPEAGNAVFDLDSDIESESDILIKKEEPVHLPEDIDAELTPKKKKEKEERQKISLYKDSDKLTIFKYSDDESEPELEDDDKVPFAKRVAKQLEEVDDDDRKAQAQRLKEKRRKKLAKLKEEQRALEERRAAKRGVVGPVTIGNPLDESDMEGSGEDGSNSYNSQSDNQDDGSSGAGSSDESDEDVFQSNKRARPDSNSSDSDSPPPLKKVKYNNNNSNFRPKSKHYKGKK